MDIATIIGLAMSFGFLAYSIAIGSGLSAFIDLPSAYIVIGGTVGAAFVNFPLDHMVSTGRVLKNAFLHQPIDPREIIAQMSEFATRARREGILALEEAVENTSNAFLKKGIQLAVDGEDPQVIENILDTEIAWLKDRHRIGAEVFSTMGGVAPAFGLLGTLIGLVGMLKNMNDPSTIGPSMAVALITTFYGAILANIVFNPIAGKLRARSSEEVLVRELTREGVLSISAGDNPRMLEEKLNVFLAPKLRDNGLE